jgi:hypothetical protein
MHTYTAPVDALHRCTHSILTLPMQATIILINAIYFKGDWLHPFKK